MNAATVHRGPDGTKTFFDDGVSFGFNRLAIIDLSEKSMQPMTDTTERYVMVFNGEIYNYKELKKELSEYPFHSEGDGEVILAGFLRWGMAVFSRLNGMFAIAIWDKQEKKLVLARDSVGIKPLYYHFDGTRLAFSSEAKGILEAGVSPILNQEALAHYLRLMYVPEPLTMFKGIMKVPKGHTLTFSVGRIAIEPFRGRFDVPPASGSYSEATALVQDTVSRAVERQLVSDRPVGVYLSGGIDSSVVLAAASKVHPHINTYSVGFELEDAEESEKFNADASLAKKTAEFFGATHHEFFLSSSKVLELFTETVRHLDEPIGNATALSQLFLAGEVKGTATVALTGDGGDELFGGYERYRLALIAEMLGPFIPEGVSRRFNALRNLHHSGTDRYAQLMFQKEKTLSRILSTNISADTQKFFTPFFTEGRNVARGLMQADEEYWLVDEALMRSDKASMARGVETRVPLLDLEVRSLAHSLPRSYLVTPFATKKILKDAFRKELPAFVINQPKRGWFSPGAKWLRHDNFVAFAGRVFSDSYAGEVSSLFNLKEVRALWEEHRSKQGYHYTTLWALLTFLEWAKEYRVKL